MASDLDFENRIEGALRSDRPRLRHRLRSIRCGQRAGRPYDRNLTQFAAELDRSIELREARRRSLPPIAFNDELPICARRHEIAAAIAAHQVVVVCGETGSGKSTQLPKICLALGRGVDGLIGHTQPRRIAARSVAARIAAELATPLGQAVGYKVRFSDATGERTYVKLMTDGILLAESQQDRYLNQYDTLIIDEAHERSLNIDFLLGYLRRILPRRPDLKVIVTSATIDAERFRRFFASTDQVADRPASGNRPPATAAENPAIGTVPLIEVSGRAYPVDIRHRPAAASAVHPADFAMRQAVLDAVEELSAIDSGDILIFMPTEQHIHETAKALRGSELRGDPTAAERPAGERPPGDLTPGDLAMGEFAMGEFTMVETPMGERRAVPASIRQTEIVPLYARLTAGEQQRVFEPHSHRRIVIATNVAESSLTVSGIRYVIDTGTARISRYASRSKSQRLPIEPISQASADQRAGRCGRVGPGVCIRLYSAEDYARRPRFTPPEIQRSNLAGVILQAKALGLGALEDFPLLDRPRPDAVRDGYATLFELGAIDEHKQLTEIGQALARLPVDPRLGRLILAGDRENCLHEILVIAAALAAQDPRERPRDRAEAADLAHAQFIDERSDFLTYWNLWTYVRDLKARLSRSQFRKACQDSFLSHARLREWQEARRQLARVTAQAGLREGIARRDPFDAIHRALLIAFLSNVARRSPRQSRRGKRGIERPAPSRYDLTGQRTAIVWPGAGVGRHSPKWIVASEVVETHRRYLRVVGRIERRWIEQLAPHLVRRSYYDPHWDPAEGAAIVYEDVSLFGLAVTHGRRVRLASVDPRHAREIFLCSGLVRGDYSTRARFLAHNREMLLHCEQLEQRSRRQGLVRGEEAHYAFYAARVPHEVVDGRTFEAWRRHAEQADPRRLFLRESDLLRPGGESLDPRDYPDAMFLRGLRATLEYVFEPGDPRDGVTACVPREGFRYLDPQKLDWLVPGLVGEKVAALLKTLPKSLRRRLFPLAEAARGIAFQIGYGNGSLVWSVARAASKLAGESIPPGLFRPERLPDYLKMRIRVVDASGRTVAVGRDVSQLRRSLWAAAEDYAPQRIGEVYLDGALWNRHGITTWDFGELPDEIQLPEPEFTLVGYPAVVDQGDSVALELMPCSELAARESRRGIRRLAVLAYEPSLVAQVEWLPALAEMISDAAAWMDDRQLRRQLVDLLADWTFFARETNAAGADASASLQGPRDDVEFAACLAAGRERLGIGAQELTEFVGPLFRLCRQVRERLLERSDPRWNYAICDMRRQLDELARPGFLTATPRRNLTRLPKYLAAIAARLDRLAAGLLERDEAHFAELHPRWQNVLALLADERAEGQFDPELEVYRWMLEDYRVAVFAPGSIPGEAANLARLDAQWNRLRLD